MQLRHASIPSGVSMPEVLRMSGDKPLQLTLRSLKRRIQFSTELWQQTSSTFLKTLDGVKVARVRAVPLGTSQGDRIFELGSYSQDGEQEAERRLPRTAALFVGAGREPISLSDLKDKMTGAEWGGSTNADFQPPASTTGPRSWCSRELSADGHVSLSWSGKTGDANKLQRAAEAGGTAATNGGATDSAGPSAVLRLEGVPGEQFFRARAALYRACALV